MKTLDKKIIFWSLAIILAAIFWSLDWIFIRPQFYELPAGLVVFLEHILGFILLSPFVFMWLWKIKKLSTKDWFAILRVCIFGGLIGTLFITKAFFIAFTWVITFATVILLQKLQPVFALIMARIILGEKLKRTFYIRAWLAILAWYFLAFGNQLINFTEIDWLHSAALFSVLAAFAFGSSTVFGKRIVNHLDFKVTTGLRFWITVILALVLILITKDFSAIGIVSELQWKYLGIIIFTSGAGALFLYYFWLKRVKASTSTILELARPLSAVILDWFINGNILEPVQVVSAIVLLGAFFMIVREQKGKKLIFSSTVIKWYWDGKKLWFHTANLENIDIDIPHGIYICNVKIKNKKYKGLMHFGFVETFNRPPSMEIFIQDFSGDLYGQTLEIQVMKKLRDIIKFNTIKELKTQIEEDIKALK